MHYLQFSMRAYISTYIHIYYINLLNANISIRQLAKSVESDTGKICCSSFVSYLIYICICIYFLARLLLLFCYYFFCIMYVFTLFHCSLFLVRTMPNLVILYFTSLIPLFSIKRVEFEVCILHFVIFTFIFMLLYYYSFIIYFAYYLDLINL